MQGWQPLPLHTAAVAQLAALLVCGVESKNSCDVNTLVVPLPPQHRPQYICVCINIYLVNVAYMPISSVHRNPLCIERLQSKYICIYGLATVATSIMSVKTL